MIYDIKMVYYILYYEDETDNEFFRFRLKLEKHGCLRLYNITYSYNINIP